MKNKAKQELEIWKMHPDFSFIEGSNLGRVRTLDRWVNCGKEKRFIKGRILKQRHNNRGYMLVSFKDDRRSFDMLVHRIIASCFIPNPIELEEVNHRDCDPENNCANNLEWCTRKYNIQYKEKYGTSAAEAAPKKPVIAVNLTTLKVSKFPSRVEAGRELGIDQRNISKVIKGKQKQTGGYWFVNDNGSGFEINKDKIQDIVDGGVPDYSVFAINSITFEVSKFCSQREAERILGISHQSINGAIAGKRKTAGGYWFVRENEDAVKIVKRKFNDTMNGKISKVPVFAVNPNTLEVLCFPSQHEAGRKLKVKQSSIYRVISGQQKTVGGYWFTKANENATNLTRAKFGNETANKVDKFGDEVADKVAKLMNHN